MQRAGAPPRVPGEGFELFAVAPPGCGDLVAQELRGLGLAGVEECPGGVAFRGGWPELYRANLGSRVASRILLRVADFEARRFAQLERRVAALEWGRWLPRGAPVAVRVSSRRSRLYHTGKIAAVVHEGLARAGFGGAGPEPGLEVYVRLFGDAVTVSLDTSGEHLHRRGYRCAGGAAPIRETLAAALLCRARWTGSEALLDPMCGSGTLAVEAALLALNLPPGSGRPFAFERFAGFHGASFEAVRAQELGRARATLDRPIFAADRDAGAVQRCTAAARRAGVAEHLQVAVSSLADLPCPARAGLLVTNPPYGRRLGGAERALTELAARLRGTLDGWRWGVVLGPGADLDLPCREEFLLHSGGLRLRFHTGGPWRASGAAQP